VAKTLAYSGGTPPGETPTTKVRQRLTDRIRFVPRIGPWLAAHNNQGEGHETPPEPGCAAANVQPLAEAPWPVSEMPVGISRMAARRKIILVAWGEPSAFWRRQIKVKKGKEAVLLMPGQANSAGRPVRAGMATCARANAAPRIS